MIAENISILLSTDHVSLVGEVEIIPSEYQLIIYIREFIGELGGVVQLNADWKLIGAKKANYNLSEKTLLREQTDADDYLAYVAAQSRLLEKLSVVISDAIKKLP